MASNKNESRPLDDTYTEPCKAGATFANTTVGDYVEIPEYSRPETQNTSPSHCTGPTPPLS